MFIVYVHLATSGAHTEHRAYKANLRSWRWSFLFVLLFFLSEERKKQHSLSFSRQTGVSQPFKLTYFPFCDIPFFCDILIRNNWKWAKAELKHMYPVCNVVYLKSASDYSKNKIRFIGRKLNLTVSHYSHFRNKFHVGIFFFHIFRSFFFVGLFILTW